ncbi:hypothetical protein QL285_069478 [Trifolium repens]|nr:hypothetical protein QL285_069478 [Trifolium repens]
MSCSQFWNSIQPITIRMKFLWLREVCLLRCHPCVFGVKAKNWKLNLEVDKDCHVSLLSTGDDRKEAATVAVVASQPLNLFLPRVVNL